MPITDPNTGIAACPSLNTAVALNVSGQRITYQPNLSGEPDPKGMQLRIDGKLVSLTSSGITLPKGGRIIRTPAAGGVQVEFPGGSTVVITPYFWDYYQVWYLAVDVRNARSTAGVMGSVAPGNWLPALPGGDLLGALPASLSDRFNRLYYTFADAWRVDDKTSLFDYASGTGSKTFVLDGWPKEGPKLLCAENPRHSGARPHQTHGVKTRRTVLRWSENHRPAQGLRPGCGHHGRTRLRQTLRDG